MLGRSDGVLCVYVCYLVLMGIRDDWPAEILEAFALGHPRFMTSLMRASLLQLGPFRGI